MAFNTKTLWWWFNWKVYTEKGIRVKQKNIKATEKGQACSNFIGPLWDEDIMFNHDIIHRAVVLKKQALSDCEWTRNVSNISLSCPLNVIQNNRRQALTENEKQAVYILNISHFFKRAWLIV